MEKADAINGQAVGLLARAAREHGTFLVHYSTDFVFDGSGRSPYRVNHPANPLSAYGRSKLLGERLLQEYAPPGWLILRTAWLYGRGGPSFPRTIVERGRQGALKVVNDQIGAPRTPPTWREQRSTSSTGNLRECGTLPTPAKPVGSTLPNAALSHFKVDARSSR